MITEANLKEIYGTTTDLDRRCISAASCWHEYEQNRPEYPDLQCPYTPYIGPAYKGIVFCGINLNGGNTSTDAVTALVATAKKDLRNQKYRIFRQPGYGGSNFYYYLPLLSYMTESILERNTAFAIEDDISWAQIIEGFDYCAITNLIKCSTATSDNRSKPSDAMWKNCIPKFQREITHIKPKVIFFFSKFLYPAMLDHHFSGAKRLVAHERYSISEYQNMKIVELGHPMATGITRKARFAEYLAAIVALKETL